MNQDQSDKVVAILSVILGINIATQQTLDSVKERSLTSIEQVLLLASIEEEFSTKINPKDYDKLTSYDSLVDLLARIL